MDICERCGNESDTLNDDLVCQDCIEYDMDMMYDRIKDMEYDI